MEEKKVVVVIRFYEDRQLKRLLRFLDKHGFKVDDVKDIEEVRWLKKGDIV